MSITDIAVSGKMVQTDGGRDESKSENNKTGHSRSQNESGEF